MNIIERLNPQLVAKDPEASWTKWIYPTKATPFEKLSIVMGDLSTAWSLYETYNIAHHYSIGDAIKFSLFFVTLSGILSFVSRVAGNYNMVTPQHYLENNLHYTNFNLNENYSDNEDNPLRS